MRLKGLVMDTWRMFGVSDVTDDKDLVYGYKLPRDMCHMFYQFPPFSQESVCNLEFKVQHHVEARVVVTAGEYRNYINAS